MKLTVIGSNSTGKTHYAGQLYGRLRNDDGLLRLRRPPSNLAALEGILRKLGEGRTASHTESDVYEEIEFSLANSSGSEFDLLFPDYAGEQIRSILEARSISPAWRNRFRDADAWILFVRPKLIVKYDDIISRPPGKRAIKISQMTSSEPEKRSIDSNAAFVELLQAALSAGGRGILSRRRDPVLTILISCWDEVFSKDADADLLPSDALHRTLPMFSEFVNANWESERLLIYGLSSLGRTLKEDTSDKDYVDLGPEHFGWIINREGKKNNDLTIPLFDTLNLISNGDLGISR